MNLPRDHEHSAYNFHSDLFLSGLERIIMVSRPSYFFSTRPSPIYKLSPVIGSDADPRTARNLPSDSFFFRLGEGRQPCTIRLCTLRSRGMCKTLAWQGTISHGRSRGLLAPHLLRCVNLACRAHHRRRPASPRIIGHRGREEIRPWAGRHLLQRRGRRTLLTRTQTEMEERSLLRDYSIHEDKVQEKLIPIFGTG